MPAVTAVWCTVHSGWSVSQFLGPSLTSQSDHLQPQLPGGLEAWNCHPPASAAGQECSHPVTGGACLWLSQVTPGLQRASAVSPGPVVVQSSHPEGELFSECVVVVTGPSPPGVLQASPGAAQATPPSALTVNRSPGYPSVPDWKRAEVVETAAPGQMYGEGVVTRILVPSQPARNTAEL